MSLAAESCRSRYTCWNPIYNGESVERVPTLWLQTIRKKPQDAQDDVTELFDLFDAHFGVGKVYRIWTPKGGPPQLRWKLAA